MSSCDKVIGTRLEALGATGAALMGIWMICFIVAHLRANENMNPIFHAVSEYGSHDEVASRSFPFIMGCWWSIGIVSALLATALGLFLEHCNPDGWTDHGKSMFILLIVFAVCRWGTSLFPVHVKPLPDGGAQPPEPVPITDVQADASRQPQMSGRQGGLGGGRRDCNSLIHMVFAVGSFSTITAASMLSDRVFDTDNLDGSKVHANHNVLQGFGYAAIATIVLMFVGRRVRARSYFGLIERLFYCAHVGWIITMSATWIQQGRQIR